MNRGKGKAVRIAISAVLRPNSNHPDLQYQHHTTKTMDHEEHQQNTIRIDNKQGGRRVTRQDYDQWEQQRLERKRRNWTLDPYR